MIEVELPDGSIAEFPAGTSNDVIKKALQKRFAPQSASVTGQAAAPSFQAGWSPASEADLAEKITGTGTFSDMTGSGIARAIPFGDEIASGLNAPLRATREWFQGDGFDVGRAYDRNMQVEEELQRRRDERSPVASIAGTVAGGLGAAAPLAAGGLSFLNGAKPTLGSLVGRGSAEGAAYGAAYGAGEGRGLNDRAFNAVTGAGAGAVVGGATGAVGRIGAGRLAEDAVPSLEQLQAAKNAAYDATDALGVQYKPQAFNGLVYDIVKDAQAQNLNPARHGRAASLIDDLTKEAANGTAPTLRQLDEFRQIVYRDIGPDSADQFFGNRIVRKIDDFIDSANVGDALTGDPASASEAVRHARELNRRYRNAQTLDEALIKAERRAASSNSGGNLENTTRQNVRRILDNDKTSRFLNASEKEALETVVRGTRGQNATRSMGNWAKGFGGHSVASGSVAASLMTGNMLPLAGVAVPYGVGAGLKAISRGIGNQNERLAEALLRSGEMPIPQLGANRKALVDALTRGSAQSIAGVPSR